MNILHHFLQLCTGARGAFSLMYTFSFVLVVVFTVFPVHLFPVHRFPCSPFSRILHRFLQLCTRAGVHRFPFAARLARDRLPFYSHPSNGHHKQVKTTKQTKKRSNNRRKTSKTVMCPTKVHTLSTFSSSTKSIPCNQKQPNNQRLKNKTNDRNR